jgi:hypothetical protein
MKIPLPAGNFIYIGKGSLDKNQTPFITKSADIIRDNKGQVVGSTNSYSL